MCFSIYDGKRDLAIFSDIMRFPSSSWGQTIVSTAYPSNPVLVFRCIVTSPRLVRHKKLARDYNICGVQWTPNLNEKHLTACTPWAASPHRMDLFVLLRRIICQRKIKLWWDDAWRSQLHEDLLRQRWDDEWIDTNNVAEMRRWMDWHEQCDERCERMCDKGGCGQINTMKAVIRTDNARRRSRHVLSISWSPGVDKPCMKLLLCLMTCCVGE